MIKYIVRPGFVYSRNDGQRHFVGFGQLVKLYHVNPRECLYDDHKGSLLGYGERFLKDLTILHPRRDGNYSVD